jgi:iron(III) transport system substrate-binding protein
VPLARRRLPWLVVLLPLLAAVAVPWLLKSGSHIPIVVVYCAHDSVFADGILRQFEQQTGIRVDVRYDEEANKSLGLTQMLLSEKQSPRCDVFWNNQTLGTIRLKNAGILQPAPQKLLQRIPPEFRDPEGCWCGFAARLRVWIVNTQKMQCSPQAIAAALSRPDLSDTAIAVPLYGTTLTQYAEMCREQGLQALQEWHQSLHSRGIREVRGNGAVRDLVAAGVCSFGLTDTDDFYAALAAGSPVDMLPFRLQDGTTVCIPNTVAMIRNCPHPETAAKLLEFLLSASVEQQLAESPARQIPLGPTDSSLLPPEVQRLLPWSADATNPAAAAQSDQQVLNWLSQSR